MAIRDKP